MIKQIFYTGFNEAYVSKIRNGKKEKLKYIKISSEIKDHSHFYEIWFEFVQVNGEIISSDRIRIDCTELCDDRGYVIKSAIFDRFKKNLEEQLAKKIQ